MLLTEILRQELPDHYHVVTQTDCLQYPYNGRQWPIRFPEVQWNQETVVLMQSQDFFSIYQDGCPELQSIQDHFGEHSHRVIVAHWNFALDRVYQGPVNLNYFPWMSHRILANLNTPRFAQWNDSKPTTRDLRWQCVNGQPRPHRRCAYEWLRGRPGGMLSLHTVEPLPRNPYHEAFAIKALPLENEHNIVRLQWLTDRAWINVVTETMYDQAPGIISEKTLMALLGQQIPIVIGYRGMVSDCRALGFDMFDDVVDHTYDDLPDSDRWRAALELNQDLLFGDRDLEFLRPRLWQQKRWLLDTWPRLLEDGFRTRCRAIIPNLTTVLDHHRG